MTINTKVVSLSILLLQQSILQRSGYDWEDDAHNLKAAIKDNVKATEERIRSEASQAAEENTTATTTTTTTTDTVTSDTTDASATNTTTDSSSSNKPDSGEVDPNVAVQQLTTETTHDTSDVQQPTGNNMQPCEIEINQDTPIAQLAAFTEFSALKRLVHTWYYQHCS
jgi:ElaB/YqjD/DUF883 family membrane-anchored ribosome-binding protein